MTYVGDAFEKMRNNGEITTTEQNLAQRRHQKIRATLESVWEIDRTFLTGSYARRTKIKPLEDVDIFAVIDLHGDQGHYRDEAPSRVVADLAALLHGKFNAAEADGMAVRVRMSDDEGQATFEIVPAYDHTTSGFEVPDPVRGRWVRTDPTVHGQLTTAKNTECDGKWVPFVKMLKGWNLEAGRPIAVSFLIEVMALDLVRKPFGRYQDEVTAFLGNLIDRVNGPWVDPARIGPDVDELLTAAQRSVMLSAAVTALAIAEEAIYLEDEGEERKAVDKWRELFGSRMPKP